ncbi:hypothetical protein MHYMCMPSP_01040 [Hyalomma marginatum]|uniref:Uncharacterized protein n=1 Tax=Hyalomma marginatum TaxID=34627 RepID=A0A8S4BX47_9ACAR|nr:hypothetical protein MHYMCMPSP_01040 [Hyalomma marginatum]CAG7598511.1 hypothetical protein MHYMCMPASI_01022 [Hyalomma marginatum]
MSYDAHKKGVLEHGRDIKQILEQYNINVQPMF